MYLIITVKEKIFKNTFGLWFVHGNIYGPDIVEKYKKNGDIRPCMDTMRRSSTFSTKQGADHTYRTFGLQPADFDTPSEFCRKKGIEYIAAMWEQLTSHVDGESIWIHRSSEITPRFN